MAVQNSNSVSITGGTITGVNIAASAITSGELALNRGGTGASLALGSNGTVLQSNGSAVVFGTNGAALTSLNASNISSGNLAVARMPSSGTWSLSGTLTISGAGIVIGSAGGGSQGAGTINAQGLYIDGVLVGTSSIPSGLIAIFESACPSGWTRVSSWDGKTLRGASSGGGTGGSDTHLHAINLNTDGVEVPNIEFLLDNSGINPPETVYGLGESGGLRGGHLHNTSGNTGSADSWPPYIEVLFCRKD